MKKLILLLALIAIGCNAPVTEGHGFWAGGEGDETFVAGPSESTDVYNQFMDAHNAQDIEAIKSLMSEDIQIWHADGRQTEGRAEQLESLQSWFDETNPSFNPFWWMTYVGVKNAETWVIAAHVTTQTIDGVESNSSQMLDLRITDGLVDLIIVYNRDILPPSDEG